MTDDGADLAPEDLVPPPAAPAPRRARPPAGGKTYDSPVLREMQHKEERGLRDWMETLAPDGEVKVNIRRKTPMLGPRGEPINGSLETVEDRIDEEYIREHWGGGAYSLSIMTPRPDGQFKIAKNISIKVAGAPKMHGRVLEYPTGVPTAAAAEATDSLAERAFESMERREREAREDARSARNEVGRSNGLDHHALSALTSPYQEQLSQAMRSIAELQGRLIDQANRPPPTDPFRDQLMSKMMDSEKTATESLRAIYEGRLEQQRERYEGRIDRLVETHEAAITRLEDRQTDDIRRMEARHEREISAAEKASVGTNKNTSIAYDARMDAQKETIARLERELTASTAKIATLEARKDQTIAEKANELLSVQEAIEGLGGGDKGEEKWWSKALDVIGNSSAALAVVEKLTGGPPEQQQQQPQPQMQQQPQQAQLPPPGVPWQAPDGNVYVRDEMGGVHMLDPNKVQQAKARLRKKKKAAKKASAAAANGAPAEAAGDVGDAGDAGDAGELDAGDDDDEDEIPMVPAGRPPEAGELAIAINFMENAIKGNAPPESFGATARNLMPADVLAWIMQFDTIDAFLNQVKLQPGSPLTTVGGRRFARAVHKYLREGSST
jgi:hypothetical protein